MGIVQDVSHAVVCHFDPYGPVQTARILRLMDSLTTPEEVRTLGRKLLRRRESFDQLPSALRDKQEEHEISLQIGSLVRALYHGSTIELRLAAVVALSHHGDDQRALHHAIFHDPDLPVRIAAAKAFRRDDMDPHPCESDDTEVRLAFVGNTHWVDMLVAMAINDPSREVRLAADRARQDQERRHSLRHLPTDNATEARLKRYYSKHGP